MPLRLALGFGITDTFSSGNFISLSNFTIYEGAAEGSTIGTLNVALPGTWTFTKTSDPSSISTLTGNTLTTATTFSAPASYLITIQATNGTITVTQNFTINVIIPTPSILNVTVTNGAPDFVIEFSNTVTAGYVLTLEIDTAADNWANPVVTVNHTITQDELNSYTIDLDIPVVGNGSWVSRCQLADPSGNTGNWSNIYSFSIDSSIPEISTLYPTNGTTDFPGIEALVITFTESVSFATSPNIIIYNSDGTTFQVFTSADEGVGLVISGDELTITPTNTLTASSTFYVEISSTSVYGTGNYFPGINNSTTWEFTTSSSPYDPAAQTLFTYFSNNNITISDTDKKNYNTYIVSMKNGGVWDLMDVIYLFAATSSDAALVNIVNPGTYTATISNSPTFTQYKGFTGNASDTSIDTTFNPSNVSANFTLNSASMTIRCLSGTTGIVIGDSNYYSVINLISGPTALRGQLNNNNAFNGFDTSDNYDHFFSVSLNSDTLSAYIDGTLSNSISDTPSNLSGDLTILNNNGNYSDAQIASATIGASLTADQISAQAAADLVYMQAVGAVS